MGAIVYLYNEDDDPDNEKHKCDPKNKKFRSGCYSAWCLFSVVVVMFIMFIQQLMLNRQLTFTDLDYHDRSAKFIGILSDLHLDTTQNATHCHVGDTRELELLEHFDTSFGVDRCDSSLDFVNLTLRSFAQHLGAAGDVEFIVSLGDLVGHSIDGINATIEAIATVTDLMRLHFKPGVPLYFTLGNNDVPIDYEIPSNYRDWYAMLWENLSPFLNKPSKELEESKRMFLEHGYYSIEHTSNLWIVSMNTIVFSRYCHINSSLVYEQLRWLEEVLSTAYKRNVSVLLIGHIPPELELVSMSTQQKSRDMVWNSQYIEEFNRIVSSYSKNIKLSFFSHQHADNWFVKRRDEGFISHYTFPAVSPVTVGEPAYAIGVIDESWNLIDLFFYVCPLEVFTRVDWLPEYLFQYSFKQKHMYGWDKWHPIDGSFLERLTLKIIDFNDMMQTYNARVLLSYQEYYRPNVSPYQMYCTMTENTVDGLEMCTKSYGYTTIFPSRNETQEN